MKLGFVFPFGDARDTADRAYEAERTGWDGFFVWEPVWDIDAWVALAAATCPLMHGSNSPAKKGLSSHSGGPAPFQVTLDRSRPTARCACTHSGSRPKSRSSNRTCMVEFQPRFHVAPPQLPSGLWRGRSCAPQPSLATLARSVATSCSDAPN
jgi:hypothetical protein